jgi:inosine-uridine nucleoside N-ribohydrolase
MARDCFNMLYTQDVRTLLVKKRLILDCDPGHDDAIAILLAARDPAVDLLAVTTVAGNQTLDKTSYNALRVLTLARRYDVPVAAGCARPLRRRLVTAGKVHGDSGLDGADLPEPAMELDGRHAADLIVEMAESSREDITIVATGPLTNVATALMRRPSLGERIEQVVWMGGSCGEGNVTPAAEFNAYVDPEAADVVFHSGMRLTMVGLDVTHQALYLEEDIDVIRGLKNSVAEVVADLLSFFVGTYRSVFGFPGCPLHDPCALAGALHPNMVKCVPMRVEVETRGQWTRGRTVCDRMGLWGMPQNARVGTLLDVDAFKAYVRDGLSRYGDG